MYGKVNIIYRTKRIHETENIINEDNNNEKFVLRLSQKIQNKINRITLTMFQYCNYKAQGFLFDRIN